MHWKHLEQIVRALGVVQHLNQSELIVACRHKAKESRRQEPLPTEGEPYSHPRQTGSALTFLFQTMPIAKWGRSTRCS